MKKKDDFALALTTSWKSAALITTPETLRHASRAVSSPRYRRYRKSMLLVNPRSGAGSGMSRYMKKFLGIKQRALATDQKGANLTEKIASYFGEFGIYPEIRETKSPQQATQIAKECAKQGYDLVVAAGGDGAVNAVANGLANSKTAFGVIPLGTVNLFAIQLKIPAEIRSACQLIAEGNIKRIDAGRIEERYFTTIAGVGFDAFVMKEADSKLKRMLGVLAYPLTGIRSWFTYPFRPIEVTLDEESAVYKAYLLLVGNGKYYGSNMVIAPEARLDDGKMDVVIFKRHDFWGFLKYISSIKSGKLSKSRDIIYAQAKKISIGKRGKHHIHLDGEPFGKSPAIIDTVKGALKVVA